MGREPPAPESGGLRVRIAERLKGMLDAATAAEHGEIKGRTLVETAYATLRTEIVDGTFEPGAKLRTEELRARYNVSGSTIREALTRLLGEALVTSEGQRGFRVAPATLEDFRDLTEVRKLIETEALRQAIAVGGKSWEGDIVAAFYKLSKTEERLREDPAGAVAEFEARNRDFHRALIAACPSPWLHRLQGLLYQQSERYRRLVASRRAIRATSMPSTRASSTLRWRATPISPAGSPVNTSIARLSR